mgnify:CR=1 FL=1
MSSADKANKVQQPAHVPDALVYEFDYNADPEYCRDPHVRAADLVSQERLEGIRTAAKRGAGHRLAADHELGHVHLRLGAADYLIKPLQDLAVLEHSVRRALDRLQLRQENQRLKLQLKEAQSSPLPRLLTEQQQWFVVGAGVLLDLTVRRDTRGDPDDHVEAELIAAVQENAPAGLSDLYAYSYDEAGNRESEQQGSAVQTTTHNARNQAEQRSAGGPVLVRARLAPEPAAGPWLNDTTTMQPEEEDKGPYAAPLQANVYRAEFNVTPGENVFRLEAVDGAGGRLVRHYPVNVPAPAPR